ncbi:oxidoreductase [Embleya hyalina]|uniref:NADH:flavin oxidoreductase n=1 Tax=Embleya hyalina TaxID=516124 RepID=A0A401YQQ8_9ACTN|nr:NADH:flavin oxidoreductase [Embleya hyalina]GCD96897.1 NADH:flavin oxidoreductase [Embleya hyalina]
MNTDTSVAENRVHAALAPARLGGLDLANSLAVAPMTRVSASEDGVATAEMADYYAGFARGGFGVVISEGTYTDTRFSQGYPNQPGIVTSRHVEAWSRVVEAVGATGTPMILQLMHAGALSQGSHYREDTAGPSAVRPLGEKMSEYGGSGPWDVPRAMSLDDIEEAIQGFVASAVNASVAGFAGVEIHGANGYLLDQFLTDYTNRRTDRYGGGVADRVRLVAEVVERVRRHTRPEFVVGVRLSQTKVNDFAHRWDGAKAAEIVFGAVGAAGASYLHVASEGRDWLETARLDNGETITAVARRVSGLPVIANGGMHNADQADRLLTEGHADLLSLGRGALANPDLPHRLAKGEPLEAFDHMILQPRADLDNARQWRERRAAA